MKRILAMLTLSCLALVGCANRPAAQGGASDDATRAVLSALAKTTAAGSARMAMDLTLSAPAHDVRITGDAEYAMDPADVTSVREHVTLQIPSLAPGMPSGEVEIIVAEGPVLYLRAPMFAGFLGADTRWVKMDPASMPGGGDAFHVAAGAADPAAALALMKDAFDVQAVGPDTVDGVDTTKYRATLDLVKILPRLAALSPAAGAKLTPQDIARAAAELDKVGMRQLPMDIWVDGDGYVKQLQLSIDTTAAATGAGAMSFSLTLTFSDIGGTFSIEAPPASQVTDISDLMPTGATSTTALR